MNTEEVSVLVRYCMQLRMLVDTYRHLTNLRPILLNLILLRLNNRANLDIHVIQMRNRIFDQLLLISKLVKANRQNTILLSPIAQIIHPSHIPSRLFVQIRQKPANDCTSQMARMERFGDIR